MQKSLEKLLAEKAVVEQNSKELEQVKKAVKELYDNLCLSYDSIEDDLEDYTLTINTLEELDVVWYLAENRGGLVIINTLEYLNDTDEKYKELAASIGCIW